jgi:hypothetical protein
MRSVVQRLFRPLLQNRRHVGVRPPLVDLVDPELCGVALLWPCSLRTFTDLIDRALFAIAVVAVVAVFAFHVAFVAVEPGAHPMIRRTSEKQCPLFLGGPSWFVAR